MSDNFSQDENRKTLRSFYCRDYLWELFEQMTRELGCSMDYLVNEAMRQYARSRDYSPSERAPQGEPPPGEGGGQAGPPPNQQQPGQQPGGGRAPNQAQQANRDDMQVGQNADVEHRTFEQVPAVGNRNQSGGPNKPPPSQPPNPNDSGGPPPPPSPDQQGPPSPGGGQPSQNQQQGRRNQGPSQGQGQGQQPANRETLYLLFNNNRYPIDTDRFIIGRGSQNTDLTIRDGNISRQHCAIIHRNDNWYLKDLDSTNGVEFRGNRIESKRIEEGDVFYLCDYPLQFTYRS